MRDHLQQCPAVVGFALNPQGQVRRRCRVRCGFGVRVHPWMLLVGPSVKVTTSVAPARFISMRGSFS